MSMILFLIKYFYQYNILCIYHNHPAVCCFHLSKFSLFYSRSKYSRKCPFLSSCKMYYLRYNISHYVYCTLQVHIIALYKLCFTCKDNFSFFQLCHTSILPSAFTTLTFLPLYMVIPCIPIICYKTFLIMCLVSLLIFLNVSCFCGTAYLENVTCNPQSHTLCMYLLQIPNV